MKGVRPIISVEDRLMEEAAGYFFFAERWGWTPEQVDNLPVRLYDRLPAVASIHDQVAEQQQNERLEAQPKPGR